MRSSADRTILRLFRALRDRGHTLATAESLTGGLIGSAITAIPGSSGVYWGGAVSYSVDAKVRLLGISADSIARSGVVSEETAAGMAQGILASSGADTALAVTGVAGPDGGTREIPVGTVWMASARRMDDGSFDIMTRCLHLSGSRARIRRSVVPEAARLVLEHLDRE